MFYDRTPQEEGRQSEKEFAKRIPGSGAGHIKGDWRTDDNLIECKQTSKKSFRLTEKMVEKIHREACEAHKNAVIELLMGDYQILMLVERIK